VADDAPLPEPTLGPQLRPTLPVEAEPGPGAALVATQRVPTLPKLVTPRQVSVRAVGVVLAAEFLTGLVAIATATFWTPFALMLAAILVWSVRRRTEAQRAITGVERGRELLDLNRVDEAEAALDQVLARPATPSHTRPLAAFNRGLVALRQGRFAEARARLDAVLASGWLDNRKYLQNFAPVVYASAMLVAVLEGDLEAADRYHRDGRQNPLDLDRHWFVAEAFYLARSERFTELLTKFERSWEAIEGTVSGSGIRQLQLLQAYALTRVSEHEDNYRGQHSGHEVHALLHGIRRGRFANLAAQWPELREFMVANRLL
jgi:tetratricopeptide (TPR) repeat protein